MASNSHTVPNQNGRLLNSLRSIPRLQKELKTFKTHREEYNESGLMSLTPIDGNIFNLRATIVGPKGTPYEGGTYTLLVFAGQHPFRPPKIKFVTKIYHRNIDFSHPLTLGDIDCSILSEEGYSPVMTIPTILICIVSCLSSHEIEADVDLPAYVRTAAEWNAKYANGQPVPQTIDAATFPDFVPWQKYWRVQRVGRAPVNASDLADVGNRGRDDEKQNDAQVEVLVLDERPAAEDGSQSFRVGVPATDPRDEWEQHAAALRDDEFSTDRLEILALREEVELLQRKLQRLVVAEEVQERKGDIVGFECIVL
mmetsp:Transcript_30417/g.48739  ORF Transcript_30417/g.48739 Transcript_30417/m.48739 type:complete len:311 (+) Transcript_30417:93-1025(+)